MHPERWKQVDHVLQSVRERAPEEREAFLHQACADDQALEREVRSLLALDSRAENFLARPAMEVAARAFADRQETIDLPIGRVISHYRIVEKLGGGGMGVVYRARDSRLNRDVAIKVSGARFNDRFTREARAIAALNHTNICHLYDVGPDYLVMEYVEGQDLRGPMRLADALPVIHQLIDGIEAAHEKSIVHRDLKPANIKITREGVLKILDFGLAKAMESPPTSDGEPENSPTATILSTQAGTILGTSAYMSPEQARGETADRRSDIWSFGVIVYELLTGKRLFQGESTLEILGSVLNKEPDVSTAPVRVHKLLRWSLEKDRKLRLASISDARKILSEELTPAPPATQRIAKIQLVWALALLALAAALAFAIWRRVEAPSNPSVRLTIPLPPGQEITSAPAISPDGRTVAYAAKQGTDEPLLYLRNLDSFEARPVVASMGAQEPFFSPNGKWVAFFAQGQLQKVEVAGGAPIHLAEASYPFGGTWSEDNTIIYAGAFNSGILRIPASGGTPESLTKPDGAAKGDAHLFPQALPGGRSVYFSISGQSKSGVVLPLDSAQGERAAWQQVVRQTGRLNGIFQPLAGSRGLLLLGDYSGGIRAAPFDAAHPTPINAGIAVLSNVYYGVESESRPWLAVSRNGTAVYAPGNPGKRSLVWVDREGKVEPAVKDQDLYRDLALSPDGTKAVVRLGVDLWIEDLQRGTRNRLTPPNALHSQPLWSRDGATIFYGSDRGGDWDIYSQPADGSRPEESLFKQPYDQFPQSILADGTLLYSELNPRTGTELWIRSPDGKRSALRVTPFTEDSGMFSPGPAGAPRRVAYISDESGRNEVYVQSYPSGANRIIVSSGGGASPHWSPDGKELFYVSEAALMAVPIRPDGSVGVPHKLFDQSNLLLADPPFRTFDVSPDGKRFLTIRRDPGSVPNQLNVILNWSGEVAP